MQDKNVSSPMVILANAGNNQHIWEAIIGERIHHRKHGKGTVLDVELPMILVQFDIIVKSAQGNMTNTIEFPQISFTNNYFIFTNNSLDLLEKAKRISRGRKKELEEIKRHKDEAKRWRKAQIKAAEKAELEQRAKQIREFCHERGIENLVHFTHILNLQSILEKGLLGRNDLIKLPLQHQPRFNDDTRYDGHTEAICLSISFPNYRMFFKYTQNNGNQWVILLINAAILWELECAFCIDNAASSHMRNKPLIDKKKVSVFRQMFDDYNQINREKLNVPKSFPTNPQAEVLALQPIDLRYIKEVNFYDKDAFQTWLAEHNGAYQQKFVINQYFFKPRQDWSKWSKSPLDNSGHINIPDEDIPF